jgi:hypothetical protein
MNILDISFLSLKVTTCQLIGGIGGTKTPLRSNRMSIEANSCDGKHILYLKYKRIFAKMVSSLALLRDILILSSQRRDNPIPAFVENVVQWLNNTGAVESVARKVVLYLDHSTSRTNVATNAFGADDTKCYAKKMMTKKNPDNGGFKAGYRLGYRVRDLVLTAMGLIVLYVTVMACYERFADVGRLSLYRLHIHGRYYIDNRTYPYAIDDYTRDPGLLLGGEGGSAPYSQRPIYQFAIVGDMLIGVIDPGFFVFDMGDTTVAEDQRDMVIYDDEATWRIALKARGVTDIPRLEEPAVAAASRPITEVQPWRCRVAGGILGFTDDDLAGLCALSTLLISAWIGFVFPGKAIRKTLVCLAVVAGTYGGVRLLIEIAIVPVMLIFFLPLALWISGSAARIRCRTRSRSAENLKPV